MKAKELRNISKKDLIVQLISLKKEWMNLRFRKIASELQDNSKIKIIKRNVARIITVINEKKNSIK